MRWTSPYVGSTGACINGVFAAVHSLLLVCASSDPKWQPGSALYSWSNAYCPFVVFLFALAGFAPKVQSSDGTAVHSVFVVSLA